MLAAIVTTLIAIVAIISPLLILFSPLLRHLMPDDAMPLPYAIDTPLL
jgi:hypothetical protein